MNYRQNDKIYEGHLLQKGKPSDIEGIIQQHALHKAAKMHYLLFKRLFDILVSLIAMILCLPLFILLVAAAKSLLKGAKICPDIKYGKMGTKFKTYRLSVPEALDRPLFLLVNDSGNKISQSEKSKKLIYITKFIEKTRLNKLAMFFNVLKGDMSIVGPNPINVVKRDETDILFALRLSVKPGMVCLWNGHGDADSTYNEMVGLDLKYIRERNFIYDMKIISNTFRKRGYFDK
jgi:Sugar transferases involved in lipopolysaccharide synthesis